jgi:hypothetical protein
MDDTPQHIKDLQLKKWLEKSPGERLYIALKTNEEFFLAFKKAKEVNNIEERYYNKGIIENVKNED